MTNEEKARESAKEYVTSLCRNIDNCFTKDDLDWAYEDTYRNTLDMAEWKDYQFKEYLEKKIVEESKGDFVTNEIRIFFLKEIINELFGEGIKK